MLLRYSQDFDDIAPPSYAHEGDVGFDIRAAVPEEGVLVYPNQVFDVPTGLRFDIPDGWELQIRPRSGLSSQISILNSPGTVDSGYRGEIKVRIAARPSFIFRLKRGDRIAQAVLAPVYRAEFERVEDISSDTARGEGGFGSTGV